MTPDIATARNDARLAYEISLDGTVVGSAFFTLHQGVITFTHTEVDDSVGGMGIGSRLAGFALDDARSRGLRVIAQCPFIAGYIGKHEEYADLLS